MNNFKDFVEAYSLLKLFKILLEYTLKCSTQLISSLDNKKILLIIRYFRLDSGHYAQNCFLLNYVRVFSSIFLYKFAQKCQHFYTFTDQSVPLLTHSELKCPISFENCFWHLIVANRSIVLNFYQKRPVFALKTHPRPQRPKRPMKANKGQQSPKTSKLFDIINIQCIIINKCECNTEKRCF